MTRKNAMTRKKKKARSPDTSLATVVTLRLYVAGRAPNSVMAIANLQAICQQYLKGAYKLEIVDVCEQPRRALADGVLVTPSLAKVSPAPSSNIIGNLSDTGIVLAALGLNSAAAS